MRAPATRDQADAYRYGLRRLEAALVRGDPVPLHEQIRAQRRATLAGVLLGLLGLCAVAVYAAVVPRPDWRAQAVVMGSESGAMYVVAHRPDRLIPVSNLVAARLELAALRAAGASDVEPGAARPVPVPDEALAGAPRTPAAAVAGAQAVAPGGTVPPRWAVCDEVGPGGRAGTSTVIGGAVPMAPLPPGEGVLLVDPDGLSWLLVDGRRHRIDVEDERLLAAFGLARAVPRAVSGALLAVLPGGPALVTPTVPGRGGPAPRGVPGRVGDVLVARPVGGFAQYFVVLSGGLQQVPELVAELLRVVSGAPAVRPVPLEVLASAVAVDELAVAGWPVGAPRLRAAEQAPVVCWNWASDGPPGGTVGVASALPLSAGTVPVTLAGADGPGAWLDAVAVGTGGAVRADPGGVWLVSSTGVGYPVLDAATASAVGVTVTERAPEAVLRLLPAGPPLDLRAAGRFDDLPPAG
jgi:type VII secretion protein EccB